MFSFFIGIVFQMWVTKWYFNSKWKCNKTSRQEMISESKYDQRQRERKNEIDEWLNLTYWHLHKTGQHYECNFLFSHGCTVDSSTSSPKILHVSVLTPPSSLYHHWHRETKKPVIMITMCIDEKNQWFVRPTTPLITYNPFTEILSVVRLLQ